MHARQVLGVSERQACRALGQSRGGFRRPVKRAADEEQLTKDMTRLALKYGRYGYKRITALLRMEGWRVNHKRVERLWRQEALKVPKRQKKRGRLYLNDGSLILACARVLFQRSSQHHAFRFQGILSPLRVGPCRHLLAKRGAVSFRLGGGEHPKRANPESQNDHERPAP